MPLEIRELVIKVSVEQGRKTSAAFDQKELTNLKNKIVKECLENIRLRMKHSTER